MGELARSDTDEAALAARSDDAAIGNTTLSHSRDLEFAPESLHAPEGSALLGRGALGSFTLLLLAGEPTYGFQLRQRLQQAGLEFELDGLYRLLDRLEREGFVVSDSSDQKGGVAARIYRLTAAGVGELKAEAEAIEHAAVLLDWFSSGYAELVGREDRPGSVPVRPAVLSPADPPRLRPGADEAPSMTPIDQAGLSRRAVDRLRRAGVRTLQEIAVLTEWELRRQGLWVGDIRKIVAALAQSGLSLRDGTLGGPPRGASARSPGQPPPARRSRTSQQDHASVRHSERDAAIVAARTQGETLQEIADRFGLSRERIRQILAAGGAGDAARFKTTRTRRRLAAAESLREEVLGAWKAGSPLKRIATDLGLTQAAVQGVIARHATTEDRDARRLVLFSETRCARQRGHTDESLIEAVGRVVERSGHIPTRNEYAQAARALALPSLSTVENRLGGWQAALRAAGHTPTITHRRPYTRRWTEESCLHALRALVAERGQLPSHSTYKQLSQGRPDLPSSSTLRTRLGPWSTITQRLQPQPSA